MAIMELNLDPDVSAWLTAEAKRYRASESDVVNDLVRRKIHEYEFAMKRWLNEKPRPLSRPGDRYPTRDELYDRKPPR
jgi:hypothetical protein